MLYIATTPAEWCDNTQRMSWNEDSNVPTGSNGIGGVLEMGRADRSVWLMKCPAVVASSWQKVAASAAAAGAGLPDSNIPNPILAKVVLSVDPLKTDVNSQLQVSYLGDCTMLFFYLG